jgi:hypothetical protein
MILRIARQGIYRFSIDMIPLTGNFISSPAFQVETRCIASLLRRSMPPGYENPAFQVAACIFVKTFNSTKKTQRTTEISVKRYKSAGKSF